MGHAGQSHMHESLYGRIDMKEKVCAGKTNLRKEQRQHNPEPAQSEQKSHPGVILGVEVVKNGKKQMNLVKMV